MEFRYMTKMAKTPIIDDEDNEGMSDSERAEIETEFGKPFPRSYKEFLLLGGKGANIIADMDHSLLSIVTGEPYWKDVRERCLESMAEEKVDPKGDIWIFAALGSEQCHFFYFDDEEDPQIYFYCAFFDNEYETEHTGISL